MPITPEAVEPSLVQTINGETLAGMKVVGWRWQVPVLDTYTHAYAHHWSTGPADAERLFAEADLRSLLSTLQAVRGENERLREALTQIAAKEFPLPQIWVPNPDCTNPLSQPEGEWVAAHRIARQALSTIQNGGGDEAGRAALKDTPQ